jgi:hypothetical protein
MKLNNSIVENQNIPEEIVEEIVSIISAMAFHVLESFSG